MSEFTARKITDSAGTGAPSFTYGLNIGGSDSSLIGKAFTSSGSEPSSPANGDLWYDSTNDKLYYYVAGAFKQITHSNAVTFTWGGSRGIMAGGQNSSTGRTNVIQYWDMSSASNAADFGDLSAARYQISGLSNSSRAVFARGNEYSGGTVNRNTIEYITTSTTGNATDFGDALGASGQNGANGACDGTTGLFAGDDGSSSHYNRIQKITVATTGNASDYGDMTIGSTYAALTNDATRWVCMTRYNTAPSTGASNVIDYGTIATDGNATDFGDLTVARYAGGAASDTTRALGAGGSGASNVIDYVTIQTTGNATDFGDLLNARQGMAGASNGTNAQFFGNWNDTNEINSVVIQTTGNATDHGDLTQTGAEPAGTSGAAS